MLVLLAIVAQINSGSAAYAQGWPNRPVTIVVPFGPGASNDAFTRAIARFLSTKFGQPFVVENRAGAAGFTGSYAVKKATPDGYTFLEAPNGIVPLKETMKLDLDMANDLDTVSVFARSPSALIVTATWPVTTVAEFLDYARRSPQPIFYGHTGRGDSGQLYTELLSSLTGIKFRPSTYKSAADMNTDLIAGRTQFQFVSAAAAIGHIQSGQLRLLAYVAKNEAKGAPPAPTFAEAGIRGMDVAQLWWAFFAPKGTPAEIIKKMNEGINEALKDPAIEDLFARSGAAPTALSPQESADIVKREGETIAKIIKDAGLTFD
jgi:tripartite-type tricarboxylate transporter receptor subunit TctC